MFIDIYKIQKDDKWHLCTGGGFCQMTNCGKPMDVVESRWIGEKGTERKPDPLIKDVCSDCFNFLPALKKNEKNS